jgi:hypothetical protein
MPTKNQALIYAAVVEEPPVGPQGGRVVEERHRQAPHGRVGGDRLVGAYRWRAA